MAKTLSTSVSASVSWNHSNALTGSITISNINGFSYSKTTTDGTGSAGTADLVYALQGTLSASATTTIDVAGSVTDAFGATITMARIKFFFLHHTTDTTATSITLGNATNPVGLFSAGTATHSVRNGGIFLIGGTGATGIAVSAGTTDEIKLTNADGSNTATYQIAIIGSSA